MIRAVHELFDKDIPRFISTNSHPQDWTYEIYATDFKILALYIK